GLAKAGVDLTIGPPFAGEGLHRRPLFREDGVLFVREGHPRVKRKLSAKQFNAERHIDIHLLAGAPGAGNQQLAQALAAAGLKRDTAVVVPTFVAAASVAATTDFIGGMPRRMAELLRRAMKLRIVDAPGPPLVFDMCLHWHERTHHDPAVKEFRAAVIDAFPPAPARATLSSAAGR